MDGHEGRFRDILDELEKSAHGSPQLQEVTEFMRSLKKHKRDFLGNRLLQRAISWDENKGRGIWDTEEEARKDLYWFLQGYIVESSHVVGPNGVESDGRWLVLSVDCDCARAPYVNVAKISPTTNGQKDRERLSSATAFATTKFFRLLRRICG